MLRNACLVGLVVGAGLVSVVACGDSGGDSQFGSSSGASSGNSSGASGNSSFGGSTSSSGDGDGGNAPDECKKMDIVFVIDNSGSMSQEQTNLAQNFPKFIDVINNYKTKSGDSLDYRIAVTTTDPDKQPGAGVFTTTRGAGAPAACTPGPAKSWLERADGDVNSFFSCRAQSGTAGSNNERGLAAMKLAVTTAAGQNQVGGQDFIRKDALMAFIILTDEDEGGLENNTTPPMSQYVTDFDGVKGERGRWAAAVIGGQQQCNSALGSAGEAKRLKEFIGLVGKNGVFGDICVGDLTQGLQKALATFDAACKDFPGGVK
jgi:hypothetical protein